jgi:hypothetical protein
MARQELLDAIEAKKAEINAKKAEIDNFEPSNDEAESAYSEFLDEAYAEVKIGALSWPASRVLKEMDECAFRCGLSDFISNEVEECPERFEGYRELQDELADLESELDELESEE